MESTKICLDCKEELPITQFRKNKRSPNHIYEYCTSCEKVRKKEYAARYYINKIRAAKGITKIRKLPPGTSQWNKYLCYKYQINEEQYNRLLVLQNELCAICKNPETTYDPTTKKLKRLSVDHDHKTGKVRGLLCSHCNHGLGHFQDNKNFLLQAIKYLDNGEKVFEGSN